MLGSNNDRAINASQWHGQSVVLFDVTMGDAIDFATIEAIKDGRKLGSRYDAPVRRYASPHVMIFATRELRLEVLPSDRVHIIDDLSDSVTLHMLFPEDKFPQVIGLSDPFEQVPEFSAGYECEAEEVPLHTSSLKAMRNSVLGSPLAIPMHDSPEMRKAVSDRKSRWLVHL